MAVFKCKMCGGDLEVAEEQYIAECEYCGTKQTVPGSRDENMRALYNRANNLRVACEFDKAAEIYEKIVSSDEEQSEAYFGLVLCKYGIEYVEDPRTFKRIPTCHRCSYDVASLDPNFKSAVKYAHITQRELYEAEVKKIDELQRDILARVNDGDKYDVFICYKETDDNGKRTHDSVIANDIYHELKDAGLRVFYAAITLEGKLGSAYEPIIFSALNTAKVMLVIGTRPEYFNAVWVKNEWSRFLRLMDNDRSRLLIPCYRDMDAYDMPREFAHLQAQDMGKIGFINDVVRGIKKVLGGKKQEKEATRVDTSYQQQPTSSNAANLIVRAKMALEDDEFSDAISFADQALNVEATLAEAYLIRFLAENNTKTLDELLGENDTEIVGDLDYKRAKRFATGELAETLKDFDRKVRIEECKAKYARAEWLTHNIDSDEDYTEAKKLIKESMDYQPCADLLPVLEEKYEKYKRDIYIGECRTICSRAEWLTYHLRSKSDYNEAKKLISEAMDYRPCADLLPVLEEKYKEYLEQERIKAEKAEAEKRAAEERRIAEKKRREEQARIEKEEAEKRKKKIKKISIIAVIAVTAIALIISAIVVISTIVDSNLRGGVKLELSSDGRGYTVVGVENESATDIVILSEYKGKPVTSIGNYAFSHCDSLTSITIPDSVTSIGNLAFYDCDSLTSITIPDSVTSIGSSAFYCCDSLTSITIPDGVTSIGSSAFKECGSLTSVTIGGAINSASFKSVFSNCNKLTSVTILDGVTLIGEYAFAGCDSLTSITIPDSVTSIGEHAFEDCCRLTSITIPDSVTSIGASAFFDCDNLTSITIPDSVTSIGSSAFKECGSLTSVTIGGAINSASFKSVFSNCNKLTSVTILDGVTSIGEDVFYDCDSLTSITIPDSVTSIGDRAFYSCGSLTSITIPDSITSIGEYAFSYCDNLTSVAIGGAINSASFKSVFSDCNKLTSVTILDGVTSIGVSAFFDCDNLTSITIPDSITSIGGYAFYDCDGLKSITIPDSVTSIGEYAFQSCNSLTSITIPDSVITIGASAFSGCGSLTSITIPDSVISIGKYAFFYCGSLTDIYFTGTQAEWLALGYSFYEISNVTVHYNYVP